MTNNPSNSPPRRVTEAAQLILDRIGIVANPYFDALNSGRMSREVFGRTQQQFYFAVYEFPRPMLALMTRVDDPAERLGMLDNILEEHGGFDHARFHATTFRLFCERLGCDMTSPSLVPGPAVGAFNLALWGACERAEVPTGLACLGIIELAFAHISAMIGRAVVERGWLPAEQLVHYRLHSELDLDHAAALFAPLEAKWDDTDARRNIEHGLALGAYLFDRLYRDLWREAVEDGGGSM